jgi:hypothetical protein
MDRTPPAGAALDAEAFAHPGPQYRGVVLWMLNDKIEQGEAVRQLRGFAAAGWGAIITRTYMGTRITYLSDEWLSLVDRIVAVSKEQGTRVFLQEADTKTGGYVTTALLGMEDRYRHHRLVMASVQDDPPERSTALATADEHTFYDQVVAAPGAASEFFAVMDLLDEATVHEFTRRCHQAQADHHGDDFGRTIECIWMDEPFICFRTWTKLPALPWTRRLPELFEHDWHYSLLDHLPSLFRDTGDFQRVRHHYWRTVVAQFKRAYWEPIGRWCAGHGVKFAGHLMGEDTLRDQIAWSGAIMPFYEDMQLPGIDYLTKNIATWRPRGEKFIITPKQCSSAANQLGKREVLAEMYGVSDQGLTFEDRKWIAEWLAVLGINYRCYHAAFYSLRGGRKRMYPPHLGYQQPYWAYNRPLADGMARLCSVLRQGRYAADALVIHPLESAHCTYLPDKALTGTTPEDKELISLSEHLLAIHRGFDYGDEFLIAKHGRVEGKAFTVGQMDYRAVILPSLITLRETTFTLLKAFVEAGGLLLSVGELPTRIDGVVDARVAEVTSHAVRVENAAAALAAALAPVPAALELDGPGTDDVWVHDRVAGEERAVFLVNTSRAERAEGALRLRGRLAVEEWDLFTGECRPVAAESDGAWTSVPLEFAPTQSHLLVCREAGDAPAPARRPGSTRRVPLGGTFQVRRHHANALTLDFCRFRLGDGEWSEVLPVIGVLEKLTRQEHAGLVTLEYCFQAEQAPSACALVVEDSEQCRVTVNGAEMRRQGEAFFWDRGLHVLDATVYVKAGENVVQVTRNFRPPDRQAIRDHERFYGTDLESIYVIGDFAVRRQAGGFVLSSEDAEASGDLVAAGYPFYAGSTTLAQEVTCPEPAEGERVFLGFDGLDAAVALVRVNGVAAGMSGWRPHRVEVTSLLRGEANRIEIEVVGTLRNLLGPHHYTGDLKDEVWQTHFTAVMERPDWMEAEARPTLRTWSDEYEFAPFGLSGGVWLEYEE